MASSRSAAASALAPASTYATSARSRVANARHAALAASRSGSRAGAGHRSAMANTDATADSDQPSIRAGTADSDPGRDTERMKASSSAVDEAARTELTTPANSTANASTPMPSTLSSVDREHSVPRHTNSA